MRELTPLHASGRVRILLLAAVASLVAPAARPQELFEDLVANLKSPTAKTREAAAIELGKSRRREAVAPLSALVRDPDARVRFEVVNALRSLRDLSAVPALVTSLQDGDVRIREEAISSLVEIYAERERGGPIERFLQGFSDEFERSSVAPYVSVAPEVVRGLVRTLRDEQKHIRAESAIALGILGGTSAVRDLLQALRDPEADVRAAAVAAIGKVGSSEDGRELIPLLADDSALVRNRALQAIGILQVREAGPALRELYEQNRRRQLGLRVLAVLARVGDKQQGDLFRELLMSNDPERRALAVEGLGRLSDASSLPLFKQDFQRERNGDVRMAYNFAVALLGDRAFLDGLVLALADSAATAARARAYLLELGKPIAADLLPYLSDQDAKVRGALCEILGEIGDPAAIPALAERVKDPNSEVADRANRAAERLRRLSEATRVP